MADRRTGTVRGWRAPGWVSALAWAADGVLIAAWTEEANGLLVLHPLARGRAERAFPRPGRVADGRLVAGVGWDDPIENRTHFLQVWHADGRTAGRFPLAVADWMAHGGLRVRFAPDGRTVAAVSGGGDVFVGPVGGPPERRFVAAWPDDGGATEVALGFAASRPLVAQAGWVAAAGGGRHSEVRVWDVVAGAEVWRSPPSADWVGPLAFSPGRPSAPGRLPRHHRPGLGAAGRLIGRDPNPHRGAVGRVQVAGDFGPGTRPGAVGPAVPPVRPPPARGTGRPPST